MNIFWHDSAILPDFVEYSTAHGRLHLLSMLVTEETIASVIRFSFKKSTKVQDCRISKYQNMKSTLRF